MIDQWLADPAKLTLSGALLIAVFAFWKGLVVPRWMYDTAIQNCQTERERNDRLLGELEKLAGASNIIAEKVKQRRT